MNNKGDSFILAKFDVSGIQEYIFASNRLRENAGASFQVTRVLENLMTDSFQEAAALLGTRVILDWAEEERFRLPAEEEIGAEILYTGGGNAVSVFRDRELFREVGRSFGMKIAKECTGIYLAVASIETFLEDFKDDMNKLNRRMDEVKRKMVRQPAYSPFPVVEQDNASYQPITCRNYGGKTENITKPRFEKLKAYDQIESFSQLFPTLEGGGEYGYPQDLNQLSRNHGEDSRIAVIHIDGNGMGERIKGLLDIHKDYSAGVAALRKESVKIAKLFNETYAQVLQKLWEHKVFINSPEGEADKEQNQAVFALRPIILDGDDVTILCTAELAVPIATGFLNALFQKQRNEEVVITACAGIAFVHSHFPFYAAYSIAEESCSEAKRRWYDQKINTGETPLMSCLDFQVIRDSRTEPYKGNKKLMKRPYTIYPAGNDKGPDSIENLYDTLKRLEEWPSNRLHKLYQALSTGGDALKLLEKEFLSRRFFLKKLSGRDIMDSPLFDALELWGMCRLDLLDECYNLQPR